MLMHATQGGGVWFGYASSAKFTGDVVVFDDIPLFGSQNYISFELGLAT
jgi:hypothetical protein